MMSPRQRWIAWLGAAALAVSIPATALAVWAAWRQEVLRASTGNDSLGQMHAEPEANAAALLALAQGEESGLRRRLAELQSRIAASVSNCRLGDTARACSAPQAMGHVPAIAVVLDTSRSMGLPWTMSAAQEQQLMRDIDRQFSSPLQRNARMEEVYREVNERDRRMSRAKNAILSALATVPGPVGVTLFTFGTSTCSVDNRGRYGSTERARLHELVSATTWNSPGTPLDLAIRNAAGIVEGFSADRPGYIVLVTDGFESCGGDPCAAARAAKAERPGLVINVVDIAGNPSLKCITESTGGRLFPTDASVDLGALMKFALQPVTPIECGTRADAQGPPVSPDHGPMRTTTSAETASTSMPNSTTDQLLFSLRNPLGLTSTFQGAANQKTAAEGCRLSNHNPSPATAPVVVDFHASHAL